jgi:hypothetical protein
MLAQELRQVAFGPFIECRSRLLEEQLLRLVQQRAGNGEALLPARRQAQGPIVALIKPVRELFQATELQGLGNLRVTRTVAAVRVRHHLSHFGKRNWTWKRSCQSGPDLGFSAL